jgi:hypothetical protein
LVASLVAVALAVAAAVSLPPAPPAASAGRPDYLAHLGRGLSASFREPLVLNILMFSAIVLSLGAALEEFWPIFGAKVGLARSIIALFVGAQNAIEMLVSLIAYRLSGLSTRGFYALFAIGGLVLLIAAGLFTPAAMLLLIVYSGLMKLVSIVFEGRLQHAIDSERRATISSVKGFLAQIGITTLYLSFGPVAQWTSYRMSFMTCGAAGVVIGLAYLALPRWRRAMVSGR